MSEIPEKYAPLMRLLGVTPTHWGETANVLWVAYRPKGFSAVDLVTKQKGTQQITYHKACAETARYMEFLQFAQSIGA